MYKTLCDFYKIGIVRFVVISAISGYLIGFEIEMDFNWVHFLLMCIGTFFISAGSLSLNQIQELEADSKMPRTQSRPLISGALSIKQGWWISLSHIAIGTALLFFVSYLSAIIGLIIIFLYNGLYTIWWKKKWAFAAVPGAVPGALPCTIGYAAVNANIFSSESIYLFLVMFLWQMPHFWTLSIKLKDDYEKGGFPVLPVIIGKKKTQYHMAYYVMAYVLLAIMSPFFVYYDMAYFIVVLPFCLLVLWSFRFFLKSDSEKAWLPFFIIINFSMLAFLFVPVIDKWYALYQIL